ncbi:uncharacterized protein LOC143911837 [Arctopsyche grandis]|uniref:uncharacterized protein LOC143911837 n=1 Tax=Arctopsyche grandis TaxID=121162 RepID=UPI00406D6776
MSAGTGAAFRWLELLEQEFDTAYVRLDTALGEIDADDPEVAYAIRQKMAALSSCFAQLSHKAQTIFQNSAKVEAELINLRTELVEARACRDLLEQQNATISIGLTDSSIGETLRLRGECSQLHRENAALRATVLALHSEVYGARLAAKYLDKELAGRIQQLQLLGREMKGEVRDRLWRQLESEILLQRHKTVVRACRSARGNGSCTRVKNTGFEGRTVAGEPRHVDVPRTHQQGLGISITGGREHGVPILISELEADGPAAQTGQLYVGDAILSVNNIDLRQACHKEAVTILQNQTGDCTLCVQFVAEDSDEENFLSEDEYTFKYPIFPAEDGLAGEATPTAPRTPDPTQLHRRSGSEDYSDYAVTPENNHSHKYVTQNSYYNNHNISPNQYGDYPYQISQNNMYNMNNHYEDYYTANNNLLLQHSILDMDDNTIKIQTEIKNSLVSYVEENVQSHSDGENSKDNSNEKLNVRDQFAFLNKHIDVVDNLNEIIVPLNSLNNSQSNSESTSSPVQTSSDNNIVSSGISCGNVETSDSKSPVISSDALNGNLLNDSMTELNVNEKQTVIDTSKSIGKNFRYKSARKKSYDKVIDACSNLPNDDVTYDKNNDVNQNVGFVYPKISSMKPFATNQYLGLSGNSLNNYESSVSPDSVETTPVHGKKLQLKMTKKKRVVKNKGTYQALDNANTSDMESPNKVIKPDKKYYNDTFAKLSVKTIQSIFDQSNKDDAKLKLSDEIESESFPSPAQVYEDKTPIDEIPLMSFTPEHALPNLKPNNSVTISVKSKDDNGNDKLAEVEKALQNPSKITSVHKFPMKNREFRIGTAKRIPPPPDVIHIPLKDLNAEFHMKSTVVGNVTEPVSQTLIMQNAEESVDSQELIETEINDIYPVLENIMNTSNMVSHSQADIDATLKLALSKLELSMLGENPLKFTPKALLPPLDSYHSGHSKTRSGHHKSEVLSNFAKDLIIEGNGDPDFGTPV